MSDAKVEVWSTDQSEEWPEAVKSAFRKFVQIADDNNFSVLCAVGVNRTEKRISAQFSPRSSKNPHIAEMCAEISQMFTLLERRFTQ